MTPTPGGSMRNPLTRFWKWCPEWLLVAIWVILWTALLAGALAHAMPGPQWAQADLDTSQWFRSLLVPKGSPGAGLLCCDEADGFRVEQLIFEGHYFILLDGQWVPVPDGIVLKKEVSPDGKAIIFIYPNQGAKSTGPNGTIYSFRCFIPEFTGY